MESCVCFFIKGAVIVSHSNCSFSTIVKDFVGRPGLEFPVVWEAETLTAYRMWERSSGNQHLFTRISKLSLMFTRNNELVVLDEEGVKLALA